MNLECEIIAPAIRAESFVINGTIPACRPGYFALRAVLERYFLSLKDTLNLNHLFNAFARGGGPAGLREEFRTGFSESPEPLVSWEISHHFQWSCAGFFASASKINSDSLLPNDIQRIYLTDRTIRVDFFLPASTRMQTALNHKPFGQRKKTG